MKIPGRRIRQERWVYTPQFVIAVSVEAVIPEDDPTEPCYEPQTVELLKQVQHKAELGELKWLQQHGRVYQAVATS